MSAGCADGGFRQEFEWFMRLLELLPSCKKLAEELRALWLRISSPDTPSWKKGVILLALLEAIANLPLEIPVLLALRLLVLVAFFQSEDSQRGDGSARAE